MPKSCLAEVEAFPDNDALGDQRHAFAKVYVADHIDMGLEQFVENACEFMGFSLKGISDVATIAEEQIPPDAIEGYRTRGSRLWRVSYVSCSGLSSRLDAKLAAAEIDLLCSINAEAAALMDVRS